MNQVKPAKPKRAERCVCGHARERHYQEAVCSTCCAVYPMNDPVCTKYDEPRPRADRKGKA